MLEQPNEYQEHHNRPHNVEVSQPTSNQTAAPQARLAERSTDPQAWQRRVIMALALEHPRTGVGFWAPRLLKQQHQS